jgi:hypothetical protein
LPLCEFPSTLHSQSLFTLIHSPHHFPLFPSIQTTYANAPHSNAFIFPVVYFFYPETAYRSLEEIDTIFRKTKGWFDVVSVAKNEPQRYGKNGELLIDYEQTEDHVVRSHSVVSGAGAKPSATGVENIHAEPGSGESSTYEKKETV